MQHAEQLFVALGTGVEDDGLEGRGGGGGIARDAYRRVTGQALEWRSRRALESGELDSESTTV